MTENSAPAATTAEALDALRTLPLDQRVEALIAAETALREKLGSASAEQG